jgi:hypothetical protein
MEYDHLLLSTANRQKAISTPSREVPDIKPITSYVDPAIFVINN